MRDSLLRMEKNTVLCVLGVMYGRVRPDIITSNLR